MPKYVLPPKTDMFPNNYRMCERDPLWQDTTGTVLYLGWYMALLYKKKKNRKLTITSRLL